MAVAIIGAGSIGLLFAAYVKQANMKVTLYTRTMEQADKLNKEGLYLCVHGQQHRFSVCAKMLTKDEAITDDIVIVAVKQYQLKEIQSVIRKNSKGKTFLFVQNGMAHLSSIKELSGCQILLGIVEHGAQKIKANRVIHTGIGKVKIASFTESSFLTVPAFLHQWNQPNFSIEYQSDWYKMLAFKLVANAAINPLTALFRVKNGMLLTNPYLLKLMRCLCSETVHVLQLNEQKLWKYVISICERTAENESSMYRDIQANRRTEIDAINGYIIEKAQEQNLDVPYTTFIYYSVKTLENTIRLKGR